MKENCHDVTKNVRLYSLCIDQIADVMISLFALTQSREFFRSVFIFFEKSSVDLDENGFIEFLAIV